MADIELDLNRARIRMVNVGTLLVFILTIAVTAIVLMGLGVFLYAIEKNRPARAFGISIPGPSLAILNCPKIVGPLQKTLQDNNGNLRTIIAQASSDISQAIRDSKQAITGLSDMVASAYLANVFRQIENYGEGMRAALRAQLDQNTQTISTLGQVCSGKAEMPPGQ